VNQIFGKCQVRLLIFFATARSPSKSGAAAYRRLQRWLLRSVRRTIYVSSAPLVFPTAPAQYISCDQIQFIIMFSEIIFMIFVLSSVLESCLLDFNLVMLNLVRNLNLQLSIFLRTSKLNLSSKGKRKQGAAAKTNRRTNKTKARGLTRRRGLGNGLGYSLEWTNTYFDR
jgi:hypothetical protein